MQRKCESRVDHLATGYLSRILTNRKGEQTVCQLPRLFPEAGAPHRLISPSGAQDEWWSLCHLPEALPALANVSFQRMTEWKSWWASGRQVQPVVPSVLQILCLSDAEPLLPSRAECKLLVRKGEDGVSSTFSTLRSTNMGWIDDDFLLVCHYSMCHSAYPSQVHPPKHLVPLFCWKTFLLSPLLVL